MANFSGCKCIVCEKKIEENDDVVVCPICGTPYHRECYFKEGECVNTALHESKGTYQKDCESDAEKVVDSANFNKPNSNGGSRVSIETFSEVDFDLKNGFDEKAEQNYRKMNSFVDKDGNKIAATERFDGINIGEMAAYINKNVFYYLMSFNILSVKKTKITFNLAALLIPELYFANRKMPLYALGVLILKWFLAVPMLIGFFSNNADFGVLHDLAMNFNVRSTEFNALLVISNILSYAISIGCCLFANYIYYKKSVKDISKIRGNNEKADGNIIKKLEKKGGTSIAYTIIFGILYLMPSQIIIIAAFFSKMLAG